MHKFILLFLMSFILLPSAFAQKRKDMRGMEKMHLQENADEDRDYKVDTSELREWMELAEHFLEAQRGPMRMEFSPLSFLKDFDEDKDLEFSSSEKRKLKEYLSELFSAGTKKLQKTYDLNDNKRFDKTELIQLRTDIPNFMSYALRAPEKKERGIKVAIEVEEPREERREERRKEPVKEERKLDDIYD